MFRLGLGLVLGYVAGSKAGRGRLPADRAAQLAGRGPPRGSRSAGAVQAKQSSLLPRNHKQQDTAVPSEDEDDVIIDG